LIGSREKQSPPTQSSPTGAGESIEERNEKRGGRREEGGGRREGQKKNPTTAGRSFDKRIFCVL
jgi:hypothetical protein